MPGTKIKTPYGGTTKEGLTEAVNSTFWTIDLVPPNRRQTKLFGANTSLTVIQRTERTNC